MGDVEREVHSARMLGCEISTNPLDPLEPILKMCEYHHPDEDISILERAYERAVKQHSSQRRKSGEPYIIHPLAVAQDSCRSRHGTVGCGRRPVARHG